MKIPIFMILLPSLILLSCKSENQGLFKKMSDDPCQRYELLVGSFVKRGAEGTMTFSGGLDGTLEVTGEDYNDINCTYKIIDCNTGTTEYICAGSMSYQNRLIILSPDSIQIGQSYYTRLVGE